MIILYILLGILLLFFLITLIKVEVFANYSQELTLAVKVLFFKITLLPAPEKPEKPKKEKPKKEKKPKPKKEEKPKDEKEKKPSLLSKLKEKKGLSGLVSLLLDIANIALGALRDLFSHIVIKKLNIGIALAGEDAAEVSVNYGKLCSIIYPALSVITSTAVCRNYNIAIEPVYDPDAKTEINAEVHAYLRIIFVVWDALKAGVKILIARIKL